MKILRTLLLLILSQTAFAQVKVTPLDKKAIPSSIKYSGHVVNAARYTDSEGEHIIITTETGEIKSKEPDYEDYRKAELFAYDYLVKNGTPKIVWQLHDFTIDCPFDLKARYIPKTFAVTDINKDGKTEVWLMYSVVCHGDVSPSDMKIIMYEGVKKFAIRGQSFVKLSAKETYGGTYTMDEAFKNGPEVFRQYAIQLWKKNRNETW